MPDETPEIQSNEIAFDFHPQAVTAWNEKADAFLSQLEVSEPIERRGNNWTDVPVVASFQIDEVENFREAMQSPIDGRLLTRSFRHEGKSVSFNEAIYREFALMCEKIQSSTPLKNSISFSVLEDLIFSWVHEKFTGKTNLALIDFLLPKFKKIIKEVEVWIPIAYLNVPGVLTLGTITIKTFSRQMFEGLKAEVQDSGSAQSDKETLIGFYDHALSTIQGMAAATMFVTAEPERAYEIALEETEKAIAILRLFTPANIIPRLSSCIAPLGNKPPRETNYFVFHEGMLNRFSNGLHLDDDSPFTLSPQIWEMTAPVIKLFVDLCFNPSRNEFEQVVFQSLMMHSRASLATSISDKMMYVCTAMESLLLKDKQESIQQACSERLAVLIEQTGEKRIEVIKNFREAYKLRSEFIHHGKKIKDIETTQTFLQNLQRFYVGLVALHMKNYKTKQEFIDAIDLIKLSGMWPNPDENSS